MKKKKARRLSVLLIPDDNAEPYSFRINLRLLKLFVILGVIVVIHIFGGGYAYWKWFHVSQENKTLYDDNVRLLNDNKRIYRLAARFEEVVNHHQKMLSLLGVDGVRNTFGPVGSLDTDGGIGGEYTAPEPDLGPGSRQAIESFPKSSFITRKISNLHEHTPRLPTLLPVDGYVTAEFTPNNWLYGKKHTGIDIAASRGKEIRAAGAGTVIFAGWTPKLGNLIIISHENNILTFYGHNSKLLVGEREYISKGEPIALLGSSGSASTGPHLHFEIWKDGVPVNPREYILAFHNDTE